MRDRLIELLEKAIRYADENYKGRYQNGKYCGLMADYLLSEGVIVPNVKIGQAVYYPIRHTNKVEQLFVREIVYTGSKIQFYASYLAFTVDAIGKTVFLTKELAEKALKERREKET